MAKIQEGNYILYHSLAEKDEEKSYPKIEMTIIKAFKINDLTFEDENGKVYDKYRCSTIFSNGIKNRLKNDDYDEERIFKEDLEGLMNE